MSRTDLRSTDMSPIIRQCALPCQKEIAPFMPCSFSKWCQASTPIAPRSRRGAPACTPHTSPGTRTLSDSSDSTSPTLLYGPGLKHVTLGRFDTEQQRSLPNHPTNHRFDQPFRILLPPRRSGIARSMIGRRCRSVGNVVGLVILAVRVVVVDHVLFMVSIYPPCASGRT